MVLISVPAKLAVLLFFLIIFSILPVPYNYANAGKSSALRGYTRPAFGPTTRAEESLMFISLRSLDALKERWREPWTGTKTTNDVHDLDADVNVDEHGG